MKARVFLLLTMLMLLGVSKANAQLLFTLVPDTQTGQPGTTITFIGILQNTGVQELFLNSDSFSLFGTGLTLDDAKFFINAPISLQGGDSTNNVALFDISINSLTMPGSYTGTFTVVGGADGTAQDDLASATFNIGVTAPANTPEPGAWALLASGTLGGVWMAQRRRR